MLVFLPRCSICPVRFIAVRCWRRCTPRGTIMTTVEPSSASRLGGESVQQTERVQTTKERYQDEGIAEEAQKAPGSIACRGGRSRRSSHGDDLGAMPPEERDELFEASSEMPDRPGFVFELRHRSGVWEVTRDGRLYGNFLSEGEALESAQAAVRLVVAGGGFASLSDAVIDL